MVLPNTDIAGTKVLAEKVRSEVELMGLMVDSGNGKAERTTVSVGCATFNMEDLNPETILREAKNALRSKKMLVATQSAASVKNTKALDCRRSLFDSAM